MEIKDLKEVYKHFNNLDEKEQWKWLLNTELKPYFSVILDNDSTSICFDYDEEADFLMYFKSDIGNREGVDLLLSLIGCKVENS